MAKITLMTLLLPVLIVGCASTGIKPEQRDTTGKFDGARYVSWHIKKHTTVILTIDSPNQGCKGMFTMEQTDWLRHGQSLPPGSRSSAPSPRAVFRQPTTGEVDSAAPATPLPTSAGGL